jgi:ABC-type uncharacterized transport system
MDSPASFRTTRWIRTANLVLQAALFLSFVAGVNYLAGNRALRDDPWRYDLTRYRRYSLSPETLAYLHNLQAPVRLVVTVAEESADPEVRGLLREYAYATEANPGGNRIRVEYLDLYLNRREVEKLGVDQENAIVILAGDKPTLLPIPELFQYRDGQRVAFVGEQRLTAAILGVSAPERRKLYFLVGHEELRPDNVDPVSGLSTARSELELRNYRVETLDLSVARRIPADASALVAVAPRAPYKPAEQELLRQYLGAGAGRLILFLAPHYPHPSSGLENLLSDWAVTVDDDLLCDRGPANVTEDDDLILRWFAQHPVTQALFNDRDGLRVGPSRTVRPNPARAAGNDLSTVALVAASESAWGEVSYAQRQGRSFSDSVDVRPLPGSEPPGRLPIAVASERVAARDNLPFSVPGGRLVVVGTGDLIDNARIAGVGALDLLLGAVKWTVNGETQLAIPARPIERFQLSLSAGELHRMRFTLLLALPGLAALLGIVVYWTRRR